MAALLNWIAQGCLVALATAAALRVLRPSSARLRCGVWYAALAGVLVLPALTWLPITSPSQAVVPEASDVAASALVAVPHGPWTGAAAPLVLWGMWLAWGCVRLLLSTVALLRAKATTRPFPADVELRLHNWCALRRHGRSSRLRVSDAVRSAAVLGLGPARIAVAPALLDQLTDAELDRVIVHEWAHVQRRDDVAHFGQQVIVAIAGWHPAVWWIGRQIHVEREAACDAIAAAVTGSRKAYAACLAKLAGIQVSANEPLPVPGAIASSDVARRIVRLLDTRVQSPWQSAFSVATVLAVVVVVVGGVAGVQIVAAAAPPAAAFESLVPGVDIAAAVDYSRQMNTGGKLETVGSPGSLDVVRGGSEQSGQVPQGSSALPASPAPELPAHAVLPDAMTRGDARPGAALDPPLAQLPPRSSLTLLQGPTGAIHATESSPASPVKQTTPWGAAADAGVAVGRGSQKAAVATAGFFTRFGKHVAGSF